MNSLSKVLSIIEVVFAQDGMPVTPSQAAAATGLNLATCARIMTELVEAGYLEKVSRRSGYIGGPLIFALAGRPGAYHRIVEASRRPLIELAVELGVTINLATMEQGRRRILLSVPPPGGCRVPFSNVYESFQDFHESSTGRLLLSRATDGELEEISTRLGLTTSQRKAIDTWLPQLRRAKEVVFHHSGFGLWFIGEMIEPSEFPAFVFGLGIPEAGNKDAAVDACRQTAERIEAEFKQQKTIVY